MKKIIFNFLTGLLILIQVACNSNTSSKETSETLNSEIILGEKYEDYINKIPKDTSHIARLIPTQGVTFEYKINKNKKNI